MKQFKAPDVVEDVRPMAGRRAGFPFQEQADFAITCYPVRAAEWNIYLFGLIEDSSQFIPAIEVLRNAGEHDLVTLHLSTVGGSLDATDTFLMAMRDCQAKIIARASGGVHSAGSIILLNCDEFYLSENFNCLIHNGECGSGGKYSDFKAHAAHNQKYMERVMSTTYAGFFSEQEIKDLIDGKDFWLDGDEFMERYAQRNQLMMERMQASQDEAMQVISKMLVPQGQAEKKVRKPRKKKTEQPVE